MVTTPDPAPDPVPGPNPDPGPGAAPDSAPAPAATHRPAGADAGRRLQAAWRRLAGLPGGRRIFDSLLRLAVPYSASIRPRVRELAPGRAVVTIRERRRLRNHLNSVHAIALANLGELASGLAMALALPAGTRGIPIRLEIDYVKKARGRITAEGRANPPSSVPAEVEDTATAELRDGEGDVVASVVVMWRLAPVEEGA